MDYEIMMFLHTDIHRAENIYVKTHMSNRLLTCFIKWLKNSSDCEAVRLGIELENMDRQLFYMLERKVKEHCEHRAT